MKTYEKSKTSTGIFARHSTVIILHEKCLFISELLNEKLENLGKNWERWKELFYCSATYFLMCLRVSMLSPASRLRSLLLCHKTNLLGPTLVRVNINTPATSPQVSQGSAACGGEKAGNDSSTTTVSKHGIIFLTSQNTVIPAVVSNLFEVDMVKIVLYQQHT